MQKQKELHEQYGYFPQQIDTAIHHIYQELQVQVILSLKLWMDS